VSDQYGRKRVFLICIALFTTSSLLCATAENIYLLVAFRAMQALGGGAFLPSAIGFLTDSFGRNRDRAVGMTTTTVPFGALAGPVLGGVIVAYWSWRGIFLINVPIGITLFVLTIRYIPSTRPIDAPRPDFQGVALLIGVLLPLMLGITELGNGSAFISPASLVPDLLGCSFLVLFIRHARSAESPIIPLRFLYKGGFASLNLINFLFGGCALGIGALVPLYAQERYHFSPLEAGSMLSARAIGVLSVGATSAFLIRKVGYRRPMIVGFSVASVGMITVSLLPHGIGTYAWLMVGTTLMGIGNGVSAPATNNAILHTVPGDAGAVSGLRQMFRQIGAITAVSVTSAIIARSAHPGLSLGHVFFVLALVVMVIVVPITLRIADHRGRW
jgi:MFS family permease